MSVSGSKGNSAGLWSKECEEGLNNQMNLELYASYVYMAMGNFFDRDDVATKNVSKYFKKYSDKNMLHVNQMLEFQNKRGGTCRYFPIKSPDAFDPSTFNIFKSMQCALALEVNVNKSLLALHATSDQDPVFRDFIEDNYLHEQTDVIKKLKGHITNLKRAGKGLGEYVFDKHIL